MSTTKQSKQLKIEIEVVKEIIDDTLASDEIDNDEKMVFCDAIIEYLQDKKHGIEDYLEENGE